MALPQVGKTYTITSVEHPGYNLNLLGGYGIADGTNVTLWPKSTTDTDQQWELRSDNKLYPKLSSNICLDRYIGNDSYYNNADLWTNNDSTQQVLTIVAAGDDAVIALRDAKDDGKNLFLTAPVNPEGGYDPSKVPGADGNVYWAPSINNASDVYRQRWTFTEVDDENLNPGTGGEDGFPIRQYLVGPYTVSAVTADFGTDCEQIKLAQQMGRKICNQYPFTVHYGTDFIGGTSTETYSVPDYVQEDIYASGYGEVVDIRGKDATDIKNLGYTVTVRYPGAVYGDGTNTQDVYFHYCHLADIYVEIGDYVIPSTKLAKRGMSGAGANSNHLHLEAYTQFPFSSKSDGGTTDPVDPKNYLCQCLENRGFGVRKLIPDCDAPIGSSAYCNGQNEYCDWHPGQNIYYYAADKIRNRPNYQLPDFV